ncbi:MAG: sulfur oxidation c-type cytochrome SoxX [Rubrivivax sp.]|nr:sulfur oxidation c-type cytochrome SoxX [Rubrivivax sp.]
MKRRTIALTVAAATLAAAGCAGMKAGDDGAAFKKMMQSSFSDKGIAKVDRLVQDEGQAACSSDQPPTEAVARRIEAQALATMQWPAGGNYIGDWKAGEKLAQSGKGMTWSDNSVDPATNGGNCYNCHQITSAEISYGTIGPSLWNYGKLRGVKNLNDPAAAPVIQYTWGKIWNSKAYAACSNMPRFGDHKLLNQDQIRDLMALLLDPNSPVNQ